MKNFLYCTLLYIFLLACFSVPCAASEKMAFNFQLDRTITTDTSVFNVVYDNSGAIINPLWKDKYLYVTDRSGAVLFKRKCQNGYMTVKIKKQECGNILNMYIKSKNNTSNVKKISVKNINKVIPEKISRNIKKPRVTLLYEYCCISAKKGDMVVIRDSKKIVKKLYFNKNCTKKIDQIMKYLSKGEVYIYTLNGKKRSQTYTMIPKMIYIYD